MLRRTILAAFAAALPAFALAQGAPDPKNTLDIDLKDGRVLIALRPDLAPKHVERIKVLAAKGFYDNQIFHRVIPGFMAQTGDPKGQGIGGSDLPNLPAEFSRTARFERGTVGAARTQDPNSANSQFFIMFAPASHLNGQYTIWGQVIAGMEFVDRIATGEPPRNPDCMLRVRLLADAK